MLKGSPCRRRVHLYQLHDALGRASQLVVMATPSFAVRATARKSAPCLRQDAVVVSVPRHEKGHGPVA